jgi:hypothetical protein
MIRNAQSLKSTRVIVDFFIRVVSPELSSSFTSRFRCRCFFFIFFFLLQYSSSVNSITQLRYPQRADARDGRRLVVLIAIGPREGLQLEPTRAPGLLLLLLPGRAVDRVLFVFYVVLPNSSCCLRIDDDSPPSRISRLDRRSIDRLLLL